ncbi:MAG: MptD family putative ECF transporter S component [Christensenellales bacterium]|jgi:energy-coupling factor transport system substrate-specific component
MKNNSSVKNRINAKDLINVGIFAVLYGVICMAVSMLGFIPVFIPLLAVLIPFFGGIPYMLFLTRVKKFGMIWIMAVIMGILMFVGGMGTIALPTSILFGLLADLISRSGGYSSAKKSVLGHGVFAMWMIGNFIPIVINREAYTATLISGGYGSEYADALMKLMPDWILPVLLVCCFVFGILGGLLGRALLKKHFVRAGIA